MKILSLLISVVLSFSASAQTITWSAPVTVAANSFDNLHPRVSLDKNQNPLVLWGKSSSKAAYFSRLSGGSFTTPVMLNPMSIPVFTDSWAGPDLASHGDTVYAVFKHTPEDTNHIYIVRSFDGGANWAVPVQVDNIADSQSRMVTVATNVNGQAIVGFMKFDPPMFMKARYVVTTSMDYGNSFSTDVKASGYTGGEVCDCCPAQIVSSGSTTVMLYRNNMSNLRNIWAGFSTDNGNSFSNGMSIDNSNWMINACPSTGPDGIIVGDSLYTVYMSAGGGTSRVYISKSSISSQQLGSSMQLTNNWTGLNAQNYPRIANAGNAATVVWKENAQGTSRLCIKFTNSVATGFLPSYDTLAIGSIANADVAMSNGAIHVVWQDDNTGSVMYRKGTYQPATVDERYSDGRAVRLYPNPAADFFSIPAKDVSVRRCTLFDNAGKGIEIQPAFSNGNYYFKIQDVAAGIYSVLIEDLKGKSFSSKLLIQR